MMFTQGENVHPNLLLLCTTKSKCSKLHVTDCNNILHATVRFISIKFKNTMSHNNTNF